MSFITICLILYFIMDPIGNISSFLTQVKGFTPEMQKRVILREMLFALLIMLLANFIGESIFWILEISEVTVRISSGLILFLIAFQILFPGSKSLRKNLPEEEPFVTPLAIPLTAGPALLATIMLFAQIESSIFVMLGAIFVAWLLALVTLLLGKKLRALVGENGLSALERLTGMILILLAIERFMSGVLLFTQTYKMIPVAS